ncbi:MAG: RluA family pseudouridine synthase [Candidatus Firestonebacteria bacterium]
MRLREFELKNPTKYRLDVFLACQLEESRAGVQKLIKHGLVKVNGEPVKASMKLKAGSKITVELPIPPKIDALPEDLPLDIIYDDEELAIINKAPGMVVHPACGNWTGTLVNALLFHKRPEADPDNLRPGIVHRLDKDTSGVMVVAWTKKAHASLSNQFKARTVKKMYYALATGYFKNKEGTINLPIGRSLKDRKKMTVNAPKGREAVTIYKVIKDYKDGALVEVTLKTGRTHQIRVHLAHIHHPVMGDSVYGKPDKRMPRQALHCGLLGFKHPGTGKYVEFKAEIPADMKAAMETLRPG